MLWHKDPCNKRGCGDDSCGWFKRASHGDPEVLAKIVKAFEFDWDRSWSPSREDHEPEDGPFVKHVYSCGYFHQGSGQPHFSVQGITLNLFFVAAGIVFNTDGRRNWKRSKKFMRDHLFDILMFAENPTDSLHDGLTRKFQIGCGEEQTERTRKERIESMASCIYGWILRAEQPWYRHPRWHVHHWRISCYPFWRKREKACCAGQILVQK
jgi:hypothetical protein